MFKRFFSHHRFNILDIPFIFQPSFELRWGFNVDLFGAGSISTSAGFSGTATIGVNWQPGLHEPHLFHSLSYSKDFVPPHRVGGACQAQLELYLKPGIGLHFFPDIDVRIFAQPGYHFDYLSPPPMNPFRGNTIDCACSRGGTSTDLYVGKSVTLPIGLEAGLLGLHKTFTFYDKDWPMAQSCGAAPSVCSGGRCRDCNEPFKYSSEDKFASLCPNANSDSCYCYTHFPDNEPVCTLRHILCSALTPCPNGDTDCPAGQACTYETGCQALQGTGPLCSERCG